MHSHFPFAPLGNQEATVTKKKQKCQQAQPESLEASELWVGNSCNTSCTFSLFNLKHFNSRHCCISWKADQFTAYDAIDYWSIFTFVVQCFLFLRWWECGQCLNKCWRTFLSGFRYCFEVGHVLRFQRMSQLSELWNKKKKGQHPKSFSGKAIFLDSTTPIVISDDDPSFGWWRWTQSNCPACVSRMSRLRASTYI